MEKIENNNHKVLAILLVFAIAAISIFVIVPKFWQASPDQTVEGIDFSNPAWIEQYVEKNAGIFGEDFFLNTAFSYNVRSNKMIATYASQNSVEEVRDYYLTLPGAKQTGRNDETSLDITAENEGQKFRVYNYFSTVARVFEVDLTLDASEAEQIISQLEKEFPADELAKIGEISDLVSGEVFGGYVRYRYDSFDDFAYPSIPIFSQAYIYDGTEDDYNGVIDVLKEAHLNHKYDESQNTNYFKINGQIFSVSFFETDANENVVSIGIQKEKKEEQ